MMNPKDTAIRVVNSALVNAEDNLYRAKRSFGNLTLNELEQEHGNSGYTRAEMLSGYQSRVDDLQQTITWLRNQPDS